MRIETEGKPHDFIKCDPIEKQVYNLFLGILPIQYRIGKMRCDFIIDGIDCFLKINRTVVLCVSSKLLTNSRELKRFNLPFNEELDSKFLVICKKIRILADLHRQAELLTYSDGKKVEAYLNQELGMSEIIIVTLHRPVCYSSEFSFYVHSNNSCPGDGILLCFEYGSHKISPYWNGSKSRRFIKQDFSRIFGLKVNLENAASINSKLQDFHAKIERFDPSKSAELIDILQINNKFRDLIVDFEKT